MSDEVSSYDRGLALELKLCELFKSKGYEAFHNVKRKGRSGAEHQIDVLAEYRSPLHTSQVIVEAKSYDAPIDKDRIMKLIQIVDDLGADRGIIVTTSYFTPGAIQTAEGHNVELWDRERLVRLLGEIEITAVEKGLPEKIAVSERIVKPRLSIDEARNIIQRRLNEKARGGFMGIGKVVERLEGMSILYYPYYEVALQAAVLEEQKTGLFSKRRVKMTVNTMVCVDSLTGELVTLDEEGVTYLFGYLSQLDEEEIRVMRAAHSFTAASLTGLGFSEYKARKIAARLASKGVVKAYRPKRGPMVYKLQVSFPDDPRILKSISNLYSVQEKIEADMKFTAPGCDASAVIRALKSYWDEATVKNLFTTYYPYFACMLLAEDGSRRVEMLDAVTGLINVELGKRVRMDIAGS